MASSLNIVVSFPSAPAKRRRVALFSILIWLRGYKELCLPRKCEIISTIVIMKTSFINLGSGKILKL